MPVKSVELPGIGAVKLYKRRGSRTIRLSVTAGGEVRVTMPVWAPYKAALAFVETKRAWLEQHVSARSLPLIGGQQIGKAHRLRYVSSDTLQKPTTRIAGSVITITHPRSMPPTSPTVQAATQRAAIRALRQQAEQLLPQRLAALAEQHDFSYKSLQIKQLKGRWGSCDQDKNIVLNLFLLQLDWHLIDYVILHELTHTRELNHGTAFWDTFESVLPNARALRRTIRSEQPVLRAQQIEPAVS